MDAAAKKTLLRLVPYGLYAVTVAEGGDINAFTANFLTQAAFEPPMISLAVENDSTSVGMIRRTGVFAVNFFASGQRELAGQLGRPFARTPQKLAGLAHHPAANGCPILDDALGWLECQVTGEVPAGDHTVFVAAITEAGVLHTGDLLTMAEAGFRHSG